MTNFATTTDSNNEDFQLRNAAQQEQTQGTRPPPCHQYGQQHWCQPVTHQTNYQHRQHYRQHNGQGLFWYPPPPMAIHSMLEHNRIPTATYSIQLSRQAMDFIPIQPSRQPMDTYPIQQPVLQAPMQPRLNLPHADSIYSFETTDILDASNIMLERLHSPSPSNASDDDILERMQTHTPTIDVGYEEVGLIPLSPLPSESSVSALTSREDDLLATSIQINDTDVLCGRGGAKTHPGNVSFRTLIGKYQHTYLMANKARVRGEIATGIVAEIKSKGGRFLRRLENEEGINLDVWIEIDDKAAQAKTRQALRERDPSAFGLVLPMTETEDGSRWGQTQMRFSPVDTTSSSIRLDSPVGPLILSDLVNNLDVLCGRGGAIKTHPGTIFFMTLIRKYRHTHLASNKAIIWGEIAERIVAEIKNKGGRFLRRFENEEGNNGDFWIEIGDRAAQAETHQALRDHGSNGKTHVEQGEMRGSPVGTKPSSMVAEIMANDRDILLSRPSGGVLNSNNEGSVYFRELVSQYQGAYMAAPKKDRVSFVLAIIKEVTSKGGRFLHPTRKRGGWVEMTMDKAIEKTNRALKQAKPR